jgi:hypothetical protein
VHVNFNLPTSFILLIIDLIIVLMYSSSHIIYTYLFIYITYIVSTNHTHFYEVLDINVKEEISFSKV